MKFKRLLTEIVIAASMLMPSDSLYARHNQMPAETNERYEQSEKRKDERIYPDPIYPFTAMGLCAVTAAGCIWYVYRLRKIEDKRAEEERKNGEKEKE